MAKTHALLFCLVAVVVSNGCDNKVTGVGRLDGATGQASWGIVAEECDVFGANGQIQYDDHDNDVKFHGDVTAVLQCEVAGCPACVTLGFPLADYEVHANYRSTNPAVPGDGQAVFCLTDNGEGTKATASDNAMVSVVDGPLPYLGYINYGPIRGNIQEHECPAAQ